MTTVQCSTRFSLPNLSPFGVGWQHGLDIGQRPGMALDSALNQPQAPYDPYNNTVRVPTALQPAYHLSPGPPVLNNGGLMPPVVWPEANMPSFQALAYPRVPLYHALHRQPALHMGSVGAPFAADSRFDMNFQAPSQRLESLSLEPSRYATQGSGPQDGASPARFREKALASAHKAYLDLMTYLHQGKKQGRFGGGSRSSKMIIFPKLPKPTSNIPSTYSSHQDIQTYPNHMDANLAGIPDSVMPPDSHRHPGMKQQTHPGEVATPAYYHLFNSENSPYNPDPTRNQVPMTPISGANAALEMMTHLCEQSGWKWVDGMLLGGCLHYGMEHYEQALEWFTRIVRLDEK
jgi:hypothetical protein